mgnify:CR=1 FL=1
MNEPRRDYVSLETIGFAAASLPDATTATQRAMTVNVLTHGGVPVVLEFERQQLFCKGHFIGWRWVDVYCYGS